MANGPYIIQTLELQGFRAYLLPRAFNFDQKRCLAIFARNGSGKSSLIDALEFLFSDGEGTLERLGIRAINNQAGAFALAHNLADQNKIMPRVSVKFARGKEKSEGWRNAGAGRRPRPEAATAVGGCFTVNPIIRGYALRRFVEADTAEERYTDVATWLQLGPLVEVQKNLRALRQEVRAAVNDASAVTWIDTQLSNESVNALRTWNTPVVLDYVNKTIIRPLDERLNLVALNDCDPAFATLSDRAKEEEQRIGLAGLRQIRGTIAALYGSKTNAGDAESGGAIHIFEASATKKLEAMTKEAAERIKAANAVFSMLWKTAEPFFAEGATVLEECPVCATPLMETKAGDAAGVRTHLANHLNQLSDYSVAKEALDRATVSAADAHSSLVVSLKGLSGLLDKGHDSLKAEIATYLAAVKAWSNGAGPPSKDLRGELDTLLTNLDMQIAEIESQQGDHTYAKAKSRITRFIELQAEQKLAERTKAEMEKLSEALKIQTSFVGVEIRRKLKVLLDTLQQPINNIFSQIQGNGTVTIRLELPPEQDANQQRLNLVVDFATNRTSVQPSGYLSDSQIHSVALALRLAAITRFNPGAPIVALDDIVTSYDADHRRTIAGVIAKQLAGYQVLITTHDERFFLYLKDQLPAKDWHFTRITKFDPDSGPHFADEKLTDDMIEACWYAGKSAANEMRQAEEEWLLGICRDFGVNVRIRTLERAYSYERSELASALAAFLKRAQLEPQPVPGMHNRFLSSLAQGVIENFGSHFQDGLYGDGSIGDERARWEEFKAFRSQFACSKCKRTKFKRPNELKKPICEHQGCEAQFAFVNVNKAN